MQRKIYLVDQFWWEQNRSVWRAACHILHYGVISDIEEYFFTFFFYQILPVHDSVSNLWNSRSITIISLLPPARPVRTAAAVDRGPASSSCWPIALLAESGCRSTASVHLQGNKVYSLQLSMTFFMFFFNITAFTNWKFR